MPPAPAWDVVETKKPDASQKRPPPPVDDAVRAHAEWFAWAKRQNADFGRAHGAARQAVMASDQGLPPPDVEKAAREAIAAGDTTPVDETRQAYSAWFAVANVDMGMTPVKAHAFAQAGYAAQRDGADLKAATAVAEAAVAARAGPPPPPPPPPPPSAAIEPGAFATAPMTPAPPASPPPPVELGDWGPPPGPPPSAAPPPPPPAPPAPAAEPGGWSPPTPFAPPPPPSPPLGPPPAPPEAGGWSPPTTPPPPPAAPPPPPEPAPPPPAAGGWSPPTPPPPPASPPPPPPREATVPTTPPTPARPAATRQGAIDKAVADTKVIAVTRSAAKLVPYGELKKASNRTLLSDTLPAEVTVWVVAVAGTLTSLAEPAVGHTVAYLAQDQHAGIGYDVHTGPGWPTWFDDLPDRATE